MQFLNLNTNPRYNMRDRTTKHRRNRYGQRIRKFHLFDFYNNMWHSDIKNPPILLTHNQIMDWHKFRYNELKYDQLYLWQANEFDWIPLYATNAGFLMIEKHFMNYDDVSYEQFCNQDWIWHNKISKDRLKILLQKFNISLKSIDKVGLPYNELMTGNPFVNGQHFYGPVVKDKQTSFYNMKAYDWQRHSFYNYVNRKWSYSFIRGYASMVHKETSKAEKRVANIKAAAKKAVVSQIVIYHEKEFYVPFLKLTENTIKLNNQEIVNIDTLNEKLENNQIILNPNNKNYVSLQEINQITSFQDNLFIDNRTASYTWQFQYHFQASIPHNAWTDNDAFKKLFGKAQIEDTFLILDENGFNGVPIGIASFNDNSIVLSNGDMMCWNEFCEKMNNEELSKSINLDFCGKSEFVNKNMINPQFTGSNQLISKMDIDAASRSSINTAYVGQYILIEYGTSFYLPIYVLGPKLFRTNKYIVQLADISLFLMDQNIQSTELLYKTSIKCNGKFVQIMNDPCTLEIGTSHKNQNQSRRPNLDNIPASPITGLSQETSNMVTNASQNAQDHRSDLQQFREFTKFKAQRYGKMTTDKRNTSTKNRHKQSAVTGKTMQHNNNKNSNKNNTNDPARYETEAKEITVETKRDDGYREFIPAPTPYKNHSNIDICHQIEILSTMNGEQRYRYIHRCLYHNFAMLYKEKVLLEKFDQFMQYSDYEIATALGDNTVFISLISKMEYRLRQLRMKYNSNIPTNIWYEEDENAEKPNPKAEFEDEDGTEHEVTIQFVCERLQDIDNSNTRKRFLANVLYPKLYPMKEIVDKIKVLASLLVLDDKTLAGLCVDDFELCKRALLIQDAITVYNVDPEDQQKKIQQIEAEIEIKQNNINNNDNESKNNNNTNKSKNNSKNKNENNNNINDPDLEMVTTKKIINNDEEFEPEVKIDNLPDNEFPSILQQINAFNVRNNKNVQDKRKRVRINNIINQTKYIKTSSLSKLESLLINSWSDKKYSHLRTFQSYPPCFSDRESLYDHASQKSTLFENDDQFVLKDIVTHVARRTFHNPNDYYIIRLSSKSIDDNNGKHDQFFKFKHCAEEIKGIFELVDKKDFITQRFRLSDSDFTEINATARFNAKHKKWAFEHKKYQHNYNHPNHPGLEPEWIPPCSRSILKQKEDRDGNIYKVVINEKNEQRPMKNGNVFFDDRVNDTRYVDFLFHQNAAFTGCDNWKTEMESQFNRWQEWRREQEEKQELDWDEEMELPLDTKMRIIEPKTRCTLALNIPMSKLRDHGDSVTIYNEITNIFKHYNYSQRKEKNPILIPTEAIRTVARGYKDREWIVKKTNDWRKWYENNSEYFKNCNPKKQLQLKQKIYYDHIYTNTIYVEFNKWIDEFPEIIDYKLGDIKLRCTTTKDTRLEKVMKQLYQCYTCGGIECADRKCRHYNATVEDIRNYNKINGSKMSFKEAKDWMGRFCQNCGQVGGHLGQECHHTMKCKWCGSHDHDNNINAECCYWNAIGMLCLLYYPYYIRNQQNEFGYLAWKNYLDTTWKMDDKLVIEENIRNEDIYPKLCRQLELIKMLCKNDDFFGTSDETIDKVNELNETVFRPLLNTKNKKNSYNKKAFSQNDATVITHDTSTEKKDDNNENDNENDNESESKDDSDVFDVSEEVECKNCTTKIKEVQCYKVCSTCKIHICGDCLFQWSALVIADGICPGCKMGQYQNKARYKDMSMYFNDLYEDFNSGDSDSEMEQNEIEVKQNFTITDTSTMPMKQRKGKKKSSFNYKVAKRKNNKSNKKRKRKNDDKPKCLPPNKRLRSKAKKARVRKLNREKARSQLLENELNSMKKANKEGEKVKIQDKEKNGKIQNSNSNINNHNNNNTTNSVVNDKKSSQHDLQKDKNQGKDNKQSSNNNNNKNSVVNERKKERKERKFSQSDLNQIGTPKEKKAKLRELLEIKLKHYMHMDKQTIINYLLECDNTVILATLNDNNKLNTAIAKIIKFLEKKKEKDTSQNTQTSSQVVNQQQLNRQMNIISKRKSSKNGISSKITNIQQEMTNAINQENVSKTYTTDNPSLGGKSGL